MQSHQLSSTLSPEIQAVLDLAEMQGVPVWYEHGLYMIKKIELKESPPTGRGFSENLGTQNLNTILRWIETWKEWNLDESN